MATTVQAKFKIVNVTAPTASDPGNEYLDLVLDQGETLSMAPRAPKGAVTLCIQDPAMQGKFSLWSDVTLTIASA